MNIGQPVTLNGAYNHDERGWIVGEVPQSRFGGGVYVVCEDGDLHNVDHFRGPVGELNGIGWYVGWRSEKAEDTRDAEWCANALALGLARRTDERAQREAKQELERNQAEECRAKLEELRPPWAKSLIVAELEKDQCDIQTDYFNSKTIRTVALAWSKNTRDSFAEMRKAAAIFGPTQNMAEAPTVNRNGESKTETNKKWWHPDDEHREKYSMGSGYYLSKGNGYSGWIVRKVSAGSHLFPIDLSLLMADVETVECELI